MKNLQLRIEIPRVQGMKTLSNQCRGSSYCNNGYHLLTHQEYYSRHLFCNFQEMPELLR